MSTPREELIEWLRDAYSMERGLELTLQKQAESEEQNAAVREQARRHLEETKAHAEAVKGCLEQLGSDTSSIKTGMGLMAEAMKGMGTKFAKDERVKDLLAGYASEHFEIASYLALRATAQYLGETQVVAVCDRIIPDEQRMAAWISENLPTVVTGYLQEVSAGKK